MYLNDCKKNTRKKQNHSCVGEREVSAVRRRGCHAVRLSIPRSLGGMASPEGDSHSAPASVLRGRSPRTRGQSGKDVPARRLRDSPCPRRAGRATSPLFAGAQHSPKSSTEAFASRNSISTARSHCFKRVPESQPCARAELCDVHGHSAHSPPTARPGAGRRPRPGSLGYTSSVREKWGTPHTF